MRASRRGAQAVEFGLMLPIYLGFIGALVDFGQYHWLAEGLIASVSAGARAGAATDPTLAGNDPLTVAPEASHTNWLGSEMPGAPSFAAAYEGQDPDVRIVVTASLGFEPFFGFIPLPDSITITGTQRMSVQP